MTPTDTSQPDYFHRVVDCQWACPAHTDVPEYIRLIAQGRFTDAYLLNRESNIFPGILGRVCDRPCEPACRRGRVDAKPVAICRLKRVAADHRDDIKSRAAGHSGQAKNGKRIALIGAGCASSDRRQRPHAPRLRVRHLRSPQSQHRRAHAHQHSVLSACPRGSSTKRSTPSSTSVWTCDLNSTRGQPAGRCLSEGYDAVFVATGAPSGQESGSARARYETENIHIGITNG